MGDLIAHISISHFSKRFSNVVTKQRIVCKLLIWQELARDL